MLAILSDLATFSPPKEAAPFVVLVVCLLFACLFAYFNRAVWLNVPGLIIIVTLCCLDGLVIFAVYSGCDLRVRELITSNDQVNGSWNTKFELKWKLKATITLQIGWNLFCLSFGLSVCSSIDASLFVATILIFSKQTSVTRSGAEKLHGLGLPREYGNSWSFSRAQIGAFHGSRPCRARDVRMQVRVYLPLISCEVAKCLFACSSYIDSPVFRDRQTWTFERTTGHVYSLSLRWSSEVTGKRFFSYFRFCFPFYMTFLREMVNKWLYSWNVIVTKRILYLFIPRSQRDFAGDCLVLATGNFASYYYKDAYYWSVITMRLKRVMTFPCPAPLHWVWRNVHLLTALPPLLWMPWLLWPWKMSWRKRFRISPTPMLPSFARLLVSCVCLTVVYPGYSAPLGWIQDLLFSVIV